MERIVALPRAPSAPRLALSRLAGWPGVWSLVALSVLVRSLVAVRRQTPGYFPDEYMYAELGRSLAESGRPLVRGLDSGFPALLQPLLTAPAWLIDDVATAYHLIQLVNSVVISLVAVPVYLLARRLELGAGLALLAVTLSLLPPALLYAGWVVSEPFAYPLVATALLAGVHALERPGWRASVGFLAVAGLAGFTRSQLLVLPACFVAAAVVHGARERRVLRALRDQALVLAVLAAGAVFLLSRGRLGAYPALFDLDLGPGALAGRLATQSLSLLYAAGWVTVPAALLGLALALARPRARAESAFAALGSVLIVALLVQASLWGDVRLMQERYTFYAVPVGALAFALFAARGWLWSRAHALACAGLLLVAALVPLSGYVTQFGNRHSPFLFAVTTVEQQVGVGAGALLVAAAAGALAVAAGLGGFSSRPALVVGSLAVAAGVATGVAANVYDLRRNDSIRRAYLPGNPSWVDDAEVGDVALVYAPGHFKDGLEQLFWNRSVREVLLLPDAAPLDSFKASRVSIAADGRLLAAGETVRMPLLVDSRAAAIDLRGAERVGSSPAYDLWRPAGTPRLATAAFGWYWDGWLGSAGTYIVWRPRVEGRLRFRVTAPRTTGDSTLTIRVGAERRTIPLRAGEPRWVEIASCGRGPWRAVVSSSTIVFGSDRVLSVRSTRPVWTPDPGACDGS